MKARLFVCTTCDRYAPMVVSPTRGETMLAAVEQEAVRLGAAGIVSPVPCVNSCPRPAGAAVREGRGGGVFRFARLAPQDAPALVAFAVQRASGIAVEVPASLAGRVASYTLPRRETDG
jgi:predicted metal-binding protein